MAQMWKDKKKKKKKLGLKICGESSDWVQIEDLLSSYLACCTVWPGKILSFS